ncbi:fibronectin type III domain-containing protein 1-like isoform X2 [Myxocyprinus asiaticus]|uniref:fibronectin type III domain-containing protein 1-like isoform X2 n=1 Tax=Myxocyprinus asiaticus TaxID=70543 RepID=UPI002223E6C7|nr:fibronectin type III domain-containing protein 1-like isoform X2 [Myxocyprinus asiaticus]
MSPARARTLLGLLVTLCTQSALLSGSKPLPPRNVKLTSVNKGLKVTWDPPSELDGRPVDSYSIGYGKSMKSLRFVTVDKDRRSEILDDVGGEWVKLDGFAVEPFNRSSPGRMVSITSSQINSRPLAQRTALGQQRAPQSSSGPEPPHQGGHFPLRGQNKHRVDLSQHQADQRNANKPKLASESVYVVSLQAPRAQGRSAPINTAVMSKKVTTEPEVLDEVKDITVRVLSPQSVVITWIDPLVEEKKESPGGSRHYTVKYREKGESARWEYMDTPQRRLMIETLSADSMYEFSIRISQGDQQGKWSASVFQRTPESAPSGPPENFQLKPLRGKGTAVTATWDPPEQTNGRIREYILSYAPAMKPFGAKSITYRGTTTSATIDGLTPGDRYIFKIRGVNRKGQGPQTKAIIVAMPASSSHKTSQSISKTSSYNESDNQESENQDEMESDTQTTTPAPPTNRRTRPLSQTRSYHSIFSRGSARNGGSNSRPNSQSSSSHIKEENTDEEHRPTESPTDEEIGTNEAIEDTKPESSNNVSPQNVENMKSNLKISIQSSSTTPSLLKPSSHDSVHKASEDLRPSWTPRISSIVDISRLRRPNSRTHGSRSRTRNEDSSSSLTIQESVATRKELTAVSYPEGKDSYNQISVTDKNTSVPSPQETRPEPEKDSVLSSSSSNSSSSSSASSSSSSSSLSLPSSSTSSSSLSSSSSSSGTRRISSPSSRVTSLGSGSTYPNSRRVGISTRAHRLQTGQRKPDSSISSSSSSSSSASSQSTLPTRNGTSDSSNSHSTPLHDKTEEYESHHSNQKNTEIDTTKDEEPAASEQTKKPHSDTTKEEQKENYDKREEKSDSYGSTSQTSSSTSPSLTGQSSSFPIPNRNSRVVTGSRRQDGRISWSRTASSVGAGRPVINRTPSHTSALRTQDINDKAKASPTTYPSKHGVVPVSNKPNMLNRETVSTNVAISFNNPSNNGNVKNSNDHKDDYLYEERKEIFERKSKDVVPTVTSKTTTTAVSETHKPVHNFENESLDREPSSEITSSKSLPSVPQRVPLLGSNGRVRSPVVASRLKGSRLPSRVYPVQHRRLGSASTPITTSSSSSFSQNSPVESPHFSDRNTSVSSNTNVRLTPGSVSRSIGESSTGNISSSSRNPVVGSRLRSVSKENAPVNGYKPSYGKGKNGRPNLTAANGKVSSTADDNAKPEGVRHITGPDGTKWVVDLDKGVLMNENGRVLQDSRGRPRKVILGEDGKTIFDDQGSPLVNQEGLALFGHGRHSRPVVNPSEKYLTVGGKTVVGLDRPKPRTTTTTTTTTTTSTTTTATTTSEPTTEPTTTEMVTETLEPTTLAAEPTCPPGLYTRLDTNGFPIMEADGILNCYSEEEFFVETTTIQIPTTTQAPTPETRPFNNTPSSEFDIAGKKRFTAPYVNYVRKDPGAPCSLTEALEYLQVDVLADLLDKDQQSSNQKQPPKNKPHNVTVVAMEGCHSFVILDWARPLKDDMVSGYMVHSASYDDVLNNRWSSRPSSGTHLPVENLKPNSRYYFKVQAKNIFGLGPLSETLTYVTESDDPLLIERPPGGEPIWIPFSFRYNPAHSSCKGSQFVKRTWYRKFVGVVLCNSLRYKIFMGDGLRETFFSIADSFGHGEDHCQFVDSHLDGRTGPHNLSLHLSTAQGYYRSDRQQPVNFGAIGRRTPNPFVGWYECGVPIPGKW